MAVRVSRQGRPSSANIRPVESRRGRSAIRESPELRCAPLRAGYRVREPLCRPDRQAAPDDGAPAARPPESPAEASTGRGKARRTKTARRTHETCSPPGYRFSQGYMLAQTGFESSYTVNFM